MFRIIGLMGLVLLLFLNSFTVFQSPINASTNVITIVTPTTNSTINNHLNVYIQTNGLEEKVELYIANQNQMYTTPVQTQNKISGVDYVFSIDLTARLDGDMKIKAISKNKLNQMVGSDEVTLIRKKNTVFTNEFGELKEGSSVLRKNGQPIGTRFVVWSKNATKIQVWLYEKGDDGSGKPTKMIDLIKQNNTVYNGNYWFADVFNENGSTYGNGLLYGIRAWGPNFVYQNNWRPGTEFGFIKDVDANGHRFNPNKLLIDPYAKMVNKDFDWLDRTITSGQGFRQKDSAGIMSKSVVYDPMDNPFDWTGDIKPNLNMKDWVMYEVHVRGFTKDNSSNVSAQGTYRGMEQKISYFNDLGVNAIELLPIHKSENQSPSTGNMNYWGYMTTNYFIPNRYYSADQSLFGPMNEFKSLVKSLHQQNKEMILDVVYNHTGEGGTWNGDVNVATIFSFRGLDNSVYYELTNDKQWFVENTGCGNNFNVAEPKVRQFIMDSLNYWKNEYRVDGFRYDLASVLGNTVSQGGFYFDKNAPLINQILTDIPDVKHIAEPWAIGGNSYQVGGFPSKINNNNGIAWAEWNDKFRYDILNMTRSWDDTVGKFATRMAGSSDLYQGSNRKPYHSINAPITHDGYTMYDTLVYGWKYNDQNFIRKQQRNLLTYTLLSSGTPMLNAGDEWMRTQNGDPNPYNVDSQKTWMNWNLKNTNEKMYTFTKRLIAFRKNHEALKRINFYNGTDKDNDGISDIQWSGVNYRQPDWGYTSHTLAWRIQGSKAETGATVNDNDLYIVANQFWGKLSFQLPPNHAGKKWYRVLDTDTWAESSATIESNIDLEGKEDVITDGTWTNTWATWFQGNSTYWYGVNPYSIVVFIEK